MLISGSTVREERKISKPERNIKCNRFIMELWTGTSKASKPSCWLQTLSSDFLKQNNKDFIGNIKNKKTELKTTTWNLKRMTPVLNIGVTFEKKRHSTLK
jgi:hypothetical protein